MLSAFSIFRSIWNDEYFAVVLRRARELSEREFEKPKYTYEFLWLLSVVLLISFLLLSESLVQ